MNFDQLTGSINGLQTAHTVLSNSDNNKDTSDKQFIAARDNKTLKDADNHLAVDEFNAARLKLIADLEAATEDYRPELSVDGGTVVVPPPA